MYTAPAELPKRRLLCGVCTLRERLDARATAVLWNGGGEVVVVVVVVVVSGDGDDDVPVVVRDTNARVCIGI